MNGRSTNPGASMNELTNFSTLSALSMSQLQLVYLAAAIFSGLSGFGFSAIGALTLCILEPPLAVSLLMALSLTTQAASMTSLRSEMRASFQGWSQSFFPYAVGGVLGVPIGLIILTRVPTQALTMLMGGILVLYGSWSLLRPAVAGEEPSATSVPAAASVGFVGGILGGFSAFPTGPLVIWTALKGLPKAQTRTLMLPYILVMQVVGIALLAAKRPESFSQTFWLLFLTALPVSFLGNRIGIALYKRTSKVNYRRVTLIALTVSGASLLLKGLWFSQ